jgi:hypothetical protein
MTNKNILDLKKKPSTFCLLPSSEILQILGEELACSGGNQHSPD